MSMQTLTITTGADDSEPLILKIEARDALLWEKTAKGNPSILDYLRAPTMVELYRLAHIAMKRQQQYAGSLDEFADAYDVNVYQEDQEDEPDPTQSAASADA